MATSYRPFLKQTSEWELARRTVRTVRSCVTVLFTFVALINLWAYVALSTPYPKAHLAASLMAIYLIFEIRSYLKRSDVIGLISPVFLSLIFHFLFSYILGITAVTFEEIILQRFEYFLSNLDNLLAVVILTSMLSAFCMIRGYQVTNPLSFKIRNSVIRSKLFRKEIRVQIIFLLVIQIVYLFFVSYMISIGAYGLLSTADTRFANNDIAQYLNIIQGLVVLSYFILMYRFFIKWNRKDSTDFDVIISILLIIMHVAAGALSGFKIQIVLPFVIAALAYFLATKRFPWHLVLLATGALLFAYTTIQPFRDYLGSQETPPKSLQEAGTAFASAWEQRSVAQPDKDISMAQQIAERFDLSGMTAIAMNYVDSGRLDEQRRKQFQDSILFAPVLAYIPRIIWSNKPIYAEGGWFNQVVRGARDDKTTSVGMGPIGYLYMAGGIAAVVLGFFCFGMLQSLIFEGIGRSGFGGMIVYLSLANTLVTIPSAFGPSVTGVLQTIPLAIFAQFLLLRPSNGSDRKFAPVLTQKA